MYIFVCVTTEIDENRVNLNFFLCNGLNLRAILMKKDSSKVKESLLLYQMTCQRNRFENCRCMLQMPLVQVRLMK